MANCFMKKIHLFCFSLVNDVKFDVSLFVRFNKIVRCLLIYYKS